LFAKYHWSLDTVLIAHLLWYWVEKNQWADIHIFIIIIFLQIFFYVNKNEQKYKAENLL